MNFVFLEQLRNFAPKNMETLVIQTRSKSNARLLSALARKLGEKVYENIWKDDKTETHLASESVLAKEWLNPQEEQSWRDL